MYKTLLRIFSVIYAWFEFMDSSVNVLEVAELWYALTWLQVSYVVVIEVKCKRARKKQPAKFHIHRLWNWNQHEKRNREGKIAGRDILRRGYKQTEGSEGMAIMRCESSWFRPFLLWFILSSLLLISTSESKQAWYIQYTCTLVRSVHLIPTATHHRFPNPSFTPNPTGIENQMLASKSKSTPFLHLICFLHSKILQNVRAFLFHVVP